MNARVSWLRVTLLAVLSFALAGCASEAGLSMPGAVNVDSLPYLALHQDIRIGSVDDPDYGFSRIGRVDVDHDGNVYVFEAQDHEIRVYSRPGDLVRRIGRSGEGPGEFRGSADVVSVMGDTLWTLESFSRRLTMFDLTGHVLEAVVFDEVTTPLHAAGQRVLIVPTALGSDGHFVGDRGPTLNAPPPGSAIEVTDTVFIPRVRFNTKGEVVDTAGWYPLPRYLADTEFIDVGSSRYVMPRPPSSEPYTIGTADGVIRIERSPTPSPSTFRIIRLNHGGDTVRARAFLYLPRTYPSEVLDSAAARSTRRTGRMFVLMEGRTEVIAQHPEDSAAARVAVRANISFPEYQPPVQEYELAADGALWLRREDMGGSLRTWIVLNSEDVPLGQLQLPRSMSIAWIGASELLTVERDDLDVPWLVRYRIEHQ